MVGKIRGFLSIFFIVAVALSGCAGPAPAKPPPPNENAVTRYDPAIWGFLYPDEYKTWLTTKDNRPNGKSVYKKCGAAGKIYDKLSEYPYLALLYAGWGFGVEYNEPRGHFHMLADQESIDKSRLKPGGVCLTCKTPYEAKLFSDRGPSLFSMPHDQAEALIPNKNGRIGPTCIDCHDPENMELRPIRTADIEQINSLGKKDLTYGDMKSIVCGQCHSSYIIPRDVSMKPTGLELPWRNGAWGGFSVEGMIAQIEGDSANLEWTQSVTGLKFGFIRHPEYELYSKGSVHWSKSVSCPSCHMKKVWNAQDTQYSDHNVVSPLNTNMSQCLDCHSDSSTAKMRQAVLTVQNEIVGEINTAGYATAVAAKLIEQVNAIKESGSKIDVATFNKAVDSYRQAFYRVVFLAAENSVGFHNPAEAHRIARDAAGNASEAQQLLSSVITGTGAPAPTLVNLDLPKYLNNRGEKHLNFIASLEKEKTTSFKDIRLLPYIKGI